MDNMRSESKIAQSLKSTEEKKGDDKPNNNSNTLHTPIMSKFNKHNTTNEKKQNKEETGQATPAKNLNTTDEEDMHYEVDEHIAYATSHKNGSQNENDYKTSTSKVTKPSSKSTDGKLNRKISKKNKRMVK